MKAISLRQPWAWMVAEGYKDIEFRSRSSEFRGECYIHASLKFDQAGLEWLLDHEDLPGVEQLIVYKPSSADFMVLIAKVTIVDCLEVDQALERYPDNPWLKAAGDKLGKYAYILESARKLPEPIPCRGKVFPLFFEPERIDYYKAIRDDQPDLLGL